MLSISPTAGPGFDRLNEDVPATAFEVVHDASQEVALDDAQLITKE